MTKKNRIPQHFTSIVLGFGVVVAGATMVLIGLAARGILPSLAAAKPEFSCAKAPDREVGIATAAETQQAALRLDGAARQLWSAGREYQRGKRSEQLVALRTGLAKRKSALIQAMRLDPDAAVSALLTRTERAELGGIGANCLENEVSLEGTLQAQQHDTFTPEGSRLEYLLMTDRKKTFTVYPANADQSDLVPGSRVSLRGFRFGTDAEVLFDAAAPLTTAAEFDAGGFAIVELPAAAPTTQYRVAVILAHYSDVPEPVTPTVQSMTDMMANVDAYFQENSYGQIGFASDVFGSYQLPLTAAECNYTNVLAAAMNAADPVADFTRYTNVMVVIRGTPTCPAGGLAYLSSTNYTTADGTVNLAPTWISTVMDWVVAHELGHNLGNHHASFLPCDPPVGNSTNPACQQVEYGDPYSVMGNIGMGHFAALHKDFSGFFNPGMLETVTTGPSDYVLEPIETATRGLKAVRLFRGYKTIGFTYDDYLYVEYRRSLGADAALPNAGLPSFFDGAVLRVNGSTLLHSGLFDPVPKPDSAVAATLPVGSTYTDPQSGIKIQTLGQTADALSIRVTPGRSEWAEPTVQITNPVLNGTYSGTIQVSADASDASGIAKVEFRVGNLGSKVAPFATVTSAPFTASFDTTLVPNGRTWITATAYDRAGDVYETLGNAKVSYTVINVTNLAAPDLAVTLTTPTDGASFMGPATLTATPSYPAGVWKVEFYVDGSATPIIDDVAPFTTTTALADGSHTALAAVYNFAQTRFDGPPISFTVLPDTVGPTTTLNSPTDGATVGGIVPIDFSWADNSGSIASSMLLVDGSYGSQQANRVTPFTQWWDTRGLTDGPHTFQVAVADAGSRGGFSQEATLIVDNSAPTVNLTDPVGGTPVSSAITISATASHAAGIDRVDFYYDGVRLIGTDSAAPYSMNWDPMTLTTGIHTITARAVNTYGTAATSAVVSIRLVDTVVPGAVNDLSAGSP